MYGGTAAFFEWSILGNSRNNAKGDHLQLNSPLAASKDVIYTIDAIPTRPSHLLSKTIPSAAD